MFYSMNSTLNLNQITLLNIRYKTAFEENFREPKVSHNTFALIGYWFL